MWQLLVSDREVVQAARWQKHPPLKVRDDLRQTAGTPGADAVLPQASMPHTQSATVAADEPRTRGLPPTNLSAGRRAQGRTFGRLRGQARGNQLS